MMPLTFAQSGDLHVIKHVGGPEKVRKFLANLGFVAGSDIVVISKNASNLIVNIKDCRVAISGEMANKIMVWKEL